MSLTHFFTPVLGPEMNLDEYLVLLFVTTFIIALGFDCYKKAFASKDGE